EDSDTNSWQDNFLCYSDTRTGPFLRASGNDMQPGEALFPGGSLFSTNGNYQFTYQNDGNLVLYKKLSDGTWRAEWFTSTNRANPGALILEANDGRLSMVDSSGNVVWQSDVFNISYANSRLVVQDDGNVVIYTPSSGVVWTTNTWAQSLVTYNPTTQLS